MVRITGVDDIALPRRLGRGVHVEVFLVLPPTREETLDVAPCCRINEGELVGRYPNHGPVSPVEFEHSEG